MHFRRCYHFLQSFTMLSFFHKHLGFNRFTAGKETNFTEKAYFSLSLNNVRCYLLVSLLIHVLPLFPQLNVSFLSDEETRKEEKLWERKKSRSICLVPPPLLPLAYKVNLRENQRRISPRTHSSALLLPSSHILFIHAFFILLFSQGLPAHANMNVCKCWTRSRPFQDMQNMRAVACLNGSLHSFTLRFEVLN